MSLISQLGLMARANLLGKTSAKVDLARVRPTRSHIASAVKAIKNEEARFAQRCCRQPVSYMQAISWANRMGDLSLRRHHAPGTVEMPVYTIEHAQAVGQHLANVVQLMNPPVRMQNAASLEILLNMPRTAASYSPELFGKHVDRSASPSPTISSNETACTYDAQQAPPPLTFESNCKLLADQFWSGNLETYPAFAEAVRWVVDSAPARAGRLPDTAGSQCSRIFNVIEYVRQRAPVSLAGQSQLETHWAAWSEAAERSAAEAYLASVRGHTPSRSQSAPNIAAVPDGARRSSLPINVLFRYPARDPGVETRSVPPVLQVQAANALDESRVVWV